MCAPLSVQFLLLPPATKLGQGYIFTGVCDSACSGGCLLRGGAWWRPPAGRLLLWAVRILLECILVFMKFLLQNQGLAHPSKKSWIQLSKRNEKGFCIDFLVPFPCNTESSCFETTFYFFQSPATILVVFFFFSIFIVADPGFPPDGGANTPGVCQIFSKTAWNWKNLDSEGGARPKFYYVDPPLFHLYFMKRTDIGGICDKNILRLEYLLSIKICHKTWQRRIQDFQDGEH